MVIDYTASSGHVTPRIRVDLEPHEAAALSDLYLSLFKGKTDPVATGLAKVEREWTLDGQMPLDTSVPEGGHVAPVRADTQQRDKSGIEAAAPFCCPDDGPYFEGTHKAALRTVDAEPKGLSKGDVTSDA